jgi:hypothetical protein
VPWLILGGRKKAQRCTADLFSPVLDCWRQNPFMRAGAIARTGAEITYVRFTCVAPLSMR